MPVWKRGTVYIFHFIWFAQWLNGWHSRWIYTIETKSVQSKMLVTIPNRKRVRFKFCYLFKLKLTVLRPNSNKTIQSNWTGNGVIAQMTKAKFNIENSICLWFSNLIFTTRRQQQQWIALCVLFVYSICFILIVLSVFILHFADTRYSQR